jgi:actin-like ATPase involved in cell morphogenesis
MFDPLGLSIGTMNLVAAANGSSPVIRRTVLTLYPHCAPKLGVVSHNSGLVEPISLMSGFVERIGDSVALISPDGSAHDPDLLTVEALDAMVVAVGADSSSSEITIAVPAHWKPATVQALRNALRTHVGFVRSGMAPLLVPDAIAALTAVNAEVGVPTGGVVGLLDFGGSGTCVTLMETKDEFEPISATMRYEDFSGYQIDQALLLHVIEELGQGDVDPTSATLLGQLGTLREQCREAKERLSVDAVTELAAELSGSSVGIELTREKFEDLISDRLTGFIYAFDDMLARNNSSFADLAALVTVGGGASIPLVTQRLSLHTRLPVLTASDPVSAAAKGALLIAARGELIDLHTRAAIGMITDVAGTSLIESPPRDVLVIDHDAMTDRELAWSQTEFPEVLTRFDGGGGGGGEPHNPFNDDGACFSMRLNLIDRPKEPPWRRFRLSQVLIGLCAAVAMTAVGGVAITLTAIESRHTPHQAPIVPSVAPLPTSPDAKLPAAIPTSPLAPSPLPPPPSEVPAPSAVAPSSVSTPPPPPPEPPPPPPPPPTMTTTRPAPVTTTRPPTTAQTTTPLTTAPPSSTEQPSAAESPTTSEPPPVKMTTQWLHVPLIPVPIPIQVPANQVPANQVPQNQVPQNLAPQDPGPQNPFQSPGSP